jgi:hypothetical protein
MMEMPADFWDRVAEKLASKLMAQWHMAVAVKESANIGLGGLAQRASVSGQKDIERVLGQNLSQQISDRVAHQ